MEIQIVTEPDGSRWVPLEQHKAMCDRAGKAMNHALDVLRRHQLFGHDGDEESGQCYDACEHCAFEGAINDLEDALTPTPHMPTESQGGKERIEFSRGFNGGHAIYICDENGGFRAWGEKCWGIVRPVVSYPLTVRNIDEAVACLQRVRERMLARAAREE